jgi:hypothetical protein
MSAAEVEGQRVRLRGRSPQRVRAGSSGRSVQATRDRVEVVTEQSVHVERHRRGGAPDCEMAT